MKARHVCLDKVFLVFDFTWMQLILWWCQFDFILILFSDIKKSYFSFIQSSGIFLFCLCYFVYVMCLCKTIFEPCCLACLKPCACKKPCTRLTSFLQNILHLFGDCARSWAKHITTLARLLGHHLFLTLGEWLKNIILVSCGIHSFAYSYVSARNYAVHLILHPCRNTRRRSSDYVRLHWMGILIMYSA